MHYLLPPPASLFKGAWTIYGQDLEARRRTREPSSFRVRPPSLMPDRETVNHEVASSRLARGRAGGQPVLGYGYRPRIAAEPQPFVANVAPGVASGALARPGWHRKPCRSNGLRPTIASEPVGSAQVALAAGVMVPSGGQAVRTFRGSRGIGASPARTGGWGVHLASDAPFRRRTVHEDLP